MFATRTEYDRGVNTFSPEGRLFQVEYAIESIKLGSTAVGISTAEGVVLAVEKRVESSLMDAKTVEKLVKVDAHIGVAMSGLVADARSMIEHGRAMAANHRFNYNEPIRVEACTQAVCDLALRFGESGKKSSQMSRPYGVALLIGGVDPDGTPTLYHTDPSGTFVKYAAKAIGAAEQGANTALQEQYNRSMSLAEAEVLAVTTLRQCMEEKITSTNVEIASVQADTRQLRHYTKDEVMAVFERLPPPENLGE